MQNQLQASCNGGYNDIDFAKSNAFIIACKYGKLECIKRFFNKYCDMISVEILTEAVEIMKKHVSKEICGEILKLLIIDNERLSAKNKCEILKDSFHILNKQMILQILEYFVDENRIELLEALLMKNSHKLLINEPDLHGMILKSPLSLETKFYWIEKVLIDNVSSPKFIQNALETLYKSKEYLISILEDKLLSNLVGNNYKGINDEKADEIDLGKVVKEYVINNNILSDDEKLKLFINCNGKKDEYLLCNACNKSVVNVIFNYLQLKHRGALINILRDGNIIKNIQNENIITI